MPIITYAELQDKIFRKEYALEQAGVKPSVIFMDELARFHLSNHGDIMIDSKTNELSYHGLVIRMFPEDKLPDHIYFGI